MVLTSTEKHTASLFYGRKVHSTLHGNAQQAFETKEYKFIPQSKNGSQGRTESKKRKNKKAPELTGVVFFHIFRYEVANIRSLVRLLLKPFNHIRLSISVKSERELS